VPPKHELRSLELEGQKITALRLFGKNSSLDCRKNIKNNNLRSMDMNMYGK
jgi:hypothetical protein